VNLVFVDSSAWFAGAVTWDANHTAAKDYLGRENQPLLTTDYIVDETLTLLKSRGEMSRAIALGNEFFGGLLATLHYLTQDQLQEAWQVFRGYKDKDWSFTDCTSKVVMESLRITTAFSFDQHFRQFGSVTVVP
jgi:predicted nucleic acid-binding protein